MSDDPPSLSPRLLFSTAAFYGVPLRTAFRHIAEAGFGSVEVMVTKDPDSQEPERIRAHAEEFGLSVEAVHAPFLLVARRVWGTDPVEKIRRAVEVAEAVGARLVVAHPPYRWQVGYRSWLADRPEEPSTNTSILIAVENMFPVRVVGRAGVRFHSGQDLEALERLPHAVFDTSHAAVSGLDLVETYRRLRPNLVHVHLSDNAGKGWDSHLPLGQGVLPVARLLEDMATDGYAGTISLELNLGQFSNDERASHEVLVNQRMFCEEYLPLETA
ncbi:MAG TPA: sugar phosphate isomerase/epimerase [Actinomycetota bacterium]|nr:sugar phosphate isomerase/epimerase [Actinomycetota bacterium]